MKARRLLTALAVIYLIAATASADAISELNEALMNIAAALAVLMFSIQGLKWVTSETPADRAEAKKGMIYVIVGLLVVYLAQDLVSGLYCVALGAYGVTC